MTREEQESIEKTKAGFENSFAEGSFYNRQTQDEEHLQLLLTLTSPKQGEKVLDLGTGSGYLSFAIAEKYPEAEIVGLDIVEKTLRENQVRAEKKGISNLKFTVYDGIVFPFENQSLDCIVTRYALHHFPTIEKTFGEIARVLKPGGHLVIADPTPNENDEQERFVDDYMQMKKDGHIKFYTVAEFEKLAEKVGMAKKELVMTSIRFPKKRKDAVEFDEIISRHSKEVTDGYDLSVGEEDIMITERVLNMVFQKK